MAFLREAEGKSVEGLTQVLDVSVSTLRDCSVGIICSLEAKATSRFSRNESLLAGLIVLLKFSIFTGSASIVI